MTGATASSFRVRAAPNGGRRRGIGLLAQLAAIIYVMTVVLLSYNTGLTAYSKATGAILGAAFVYVSIAGGRSITIPTEFRLLMAWFAYAVLASLAADNVDFALYRIATLLQVYPLAFVLVSLIVWNGNSRFYWGGIVFSAILSGIVVLLRPKMVSGLDGRIFGTLGNANTYGLMLSAALVVCVVTLVAGKNLLMRAISLALAGFFFYLIARTGSRQGMVVSVMSSALIFAVYAVRNRRQGAFRLLGTMALGGAVLALAISFLVSSAYWSRLGNAIEAANRSKLERADNSLKGRLSLYRRAWDLTVEHPLLGIGPHNFEALQGSAVGVVEGAYTHSNYMDVMVSTGFVGFVLYFAIYWVWWRRLLRLRFLIHDPACFAGLARAGGLVTIFLLSDFTGVSYYGKMEWMLIAGLIAELQLLEAYAGSARPAGAPVRAAVARSRAA